MLFKPSEQAKETFKSMGLSDQWKELNKAITLLESVLPEKHQEGVCGKMARLVQDITNVSNVENVKELNKDILLFKTGIKELHLNEEQKDHFKSAMQNIENLFDEVKQRLSQEPSAGPSHG